MKKCACCDKQIEKSFKYCPFCGTKQKTGDGLLDEIEEIMEDMKRPKLPSDFSFGLFRNFDKIVKELTEQLEKQIDTLRPEKNVENNVRGISIKVDFSHGTPTISIKNIGENIEENKKHKKDEKIESDKGIIKRFRLNETELKRLEKLPREEARASIKRLSNKIIYEIDVKGVKNISDVEIRKLENSIEVKAISKDKIYFKLIPIVLPIIDYELKKDKLYIYFKPEI